MEEKTLSLTKWIKAAVSCLEQNQITAYKTTILKTLYLTLPEDYRHKLYEPYLYGPYSDRVSSLLNSLASDYDSLQVDLCELPNGRWATIFASREDVNPPDESIVSKIDKTLKMLKNAAIKSAKQISFVSKVHYLAESCNSQDPQVLSEEASLMGWELSPAEVKRFLVIVDSLKSSDRG